MKALVTALLFFSIAGLEAVETEPTKTTPELIELAEQTLQQAREDNISATKEVHNIFAAADRLLEEDELEESKL